MDRFDAMRVFARIVERRSFTQAADDLGLPRSSVTDAVKGLESRLGVRLSGRHKRQVPPRCGPLLKRSMHTVWRRRAVDGGTPIDFCLYRRDLASLISVTTKIHHLAAVDVAEVTRREPASFGYHCRRRQL